MMKHRQHLVAAVASTVCAGTWLINCVLDVLMRIPDTLGKDAAMTLVWAASAGLWWLRWRQVRGFGRRTRQE